MTTLTIHYPRIDPGEPRLITHLITDKKHDITDLIHQKYYAKKNQYQELKYDNYKRRPFLMYTDFIGGHI